MTDSGLRERISLQQGIKASVDFAKKAHGLSSYLPIRASANRQAVWMGVVAVSVLCITLGTMSDVRAIWVTEATIRVMRN